MSKVFEATLHAASGGFGEYDWVERSESPASDLSEWEYLAADANPGCELRRAEELDGRIHNQNGGVPYLLTTPDWSAYYLVWEED